MIEIPGGAREWNRVSASGVRTTWSLCWHKSSSMCAIRTTSVSEGQSINAHGISGFVVVVVVDDGVDEEEGVAWADEDPGMPRSVMATPLYVLSHSTRMCVA